MKHKKYNNYCAFCGEYSYQYELCKNCYELSINEEIIKDENGDWERNIIKGNENKFYCENKIYSKKPLITEEIESKFYSFVKQNLDENFIIIPQVNLQTIITTNNYTRNDELFRNVDFCIFTKNELIPLLCIELNGKQHYYNEYYKQRDISVKKILENAYIKLITFKNEEIILNDSLMEKIYSTIGI